MKKSFMTRALATGLSLAMAFSLTAATNVTSASAAAKKPTLVTYAGASAKSLEVKVDETVKVKVNAATKKNYKISAVKVSGGKSAKVAAKTNKAGTVVAITGKTATPEGKQASVKVSFKAKKTGKTSKYSYVSKVTVAEDKLTMTASATKVKQITVNFNKTVDTTTTKLVVKKGAATPTIASTTFAADAKSAEITLGTKLTAGVYTVEATVGEEKLTADITVQDEKLTKFELVSPNLVADPNVTTIASISYKALNQYNEMMVADQPTVSCTFGSTDTKDKGKITAPSADKSGTITVGNINTSLAIPGTTGTIVIVDKTTGVNLNTSVTYQSKAVAASATVYGIYNTKTDKLIEGNLTTGTKASDYAILMSVKDQYDGYMTPQNIVDSKVEVSYNPASVLTDLKIATKDDAKKVSTDEKELTYDGASAFLLPLKTETKGGKLSDAGTLSLTIVSGQKGVIASPSFTVDEAKVIKTLSVSSASTVYALEDNAMVVEAYDAAGNAITKYDDLMAAGLRGTSNQGPVTLKKNTDGTGTLYFKPMVTSSFKDDKNAKESNIATLILYANKATSTAAEYIVKTLNVTYYEARQAWAVSGKTDKTVNACANKNGTTLSLDLTTLSYEDQYSNVVKTDDTVAKAATSAVQILLLDKTGVFGSKTNDQGRALEASEKSGNNVVLTSNGTKGDATLYFRYMTADKRATLSDDNGTVSVDKYDFKLTVSATSVSDFVASDLKVVVNKGNAVFASSAVELEKVATTDTYNNDAADKNAKNGAKAAVYVTGVVRGNTVVLPTDQFHLVTTKIDALGAYDAKNNDKTETKKVTVVVDSESGAQELTADVTVSNKAPAITTVKAADNKGIIGTASARTLTKDDFIKAVKVLDQYGNEMTGKAGDFRYEVTLTGNSADYANTTTGQKSQDINMVFTTKADETNADKNAEITATVKYTTMDGKITFTQDVTVKLGA